LIGRERGRAMQGIWAKKHPTTKWHFFTSASVVWQGKNIYTLNSLCHQGVSMIAMRGKIDPDIWGDPRHFVGKKEDVCKKCLRRIANGEKLHKMLLKKG
jgi:hypothetical protein